MREREIIFSSQWFIPAGRNQNPEALDFTCVSWMDRMVDVPLTSYTAFLGTAAWILGGMWNTQDSYQCSCGVLASQMEAILVLFQCWPPNLIFFAT